MRSSGERRDSNRPCELDADRRDTSRRDAHEPTRLGGPEYSDRAPTPDRALLRKRPSIFRTSLRAEKTPGASPASSSSEPSSFEHLEELGQSPSAYGEPDSISHRSSSTRRPRSDERILEDIESALDQEGELDASEIVASCRDGIVTLKGQVDHRRSRSIAESLVVSVLGVRDVINTLEVDADSFSKPPFTKGDSNGNWTQ